MENNSVHQENVETKLCSHCQKEIPKKATRCSYCQSDLRSWINRHPVLTVLGVCFYIFWALGSIGGANQSVSTSQVPNIPVQNKPMSSFGDGNFIVNSDIQPGTYKSSGGDNCYYARLSGFGGTVDDIIANKNTNLSAIVTIASTDKGFISERCGRWTKLPANSGALSKNSATKNTVSLVPQPATAPIANAISISTAIKNYSDVTASNVDVIGTVTDLQPAQSDPVLAPFGNTVFIKDGVYSAAVHNVSLGDFQNLSLGKLVEVTGGYMQTPSSDASGGGWVAQIVRTKSVVVIGH